MGTFELIRDLSKELTDRTETASYAAYGKNHLVIDFTEILEDFFEAYNPTPDLFPHAPEEVREAFTLCKIHDIAYFNWRECPKCSPQKKAHPYSKFFKSEIIEGKK